jgi:hypothetical protein
MIAVLIMLLLAWALDRAWRAAQGPPRPTMRTVIPLSVFPQSLAN